MSVRLARQSFDRDWGRLLEANPLEPRRRIEGASAVWAHFRGRVAELKQETFYALLLDAQTRLMREQLVSSGTLTESLAHPREVFRPAVRESAASVIFVHNHPCGDPAPSASDVELTKRLVDAGKVLGVPVADHVIVAAGGYFSFVEHGAKPE